MPLADGSGSIDICIYQILHKHIIKIITRKIGNQLELGQTQFRSHFGSSLWDVSIACGMCLLFVECADRLRNFCIADGMFLLLVECVHCFWYVSLLAQANHYVAPIAFDLYTHIDLSSYATLVWLKFGPSLFQLLQVSNYHAAAGHTFGELSNRVFGRAGPAIAPSKSTFRFASFRAKHTATPCTVDVFRLASHTSLTGPVSLTGWVRINRVDAQKTLTAAPKHR